MLLSPLELLKGTRLPLYLYNIDNINCIENPTHAIIYRVFEFILASLNILYYLSFPLVSSWELSRFPVAC